MALRRLRAVGLLQVFFEDRIKVHDAARVIGKARLLLSDGGDIGSKRRILRDLLLDNLASDWSFARLTLVLRLSAQIGHLSLLAEMAQDEMFHEMGVWTEVEAFLIEASRDEAHDPGERIKALDGLAFAHLKAGDERAEDWLDQMDALIVIHALDDEDRLRVAMKRMSLLARRRDHKGAEAVIGGIMPLIDAAPEAHRRIFRYNLATTHLALGQGAAAENLLIPVVDEYYRILGLSPDAVLGKNAPEIAEFLEGIDYIDDAKHLADALDALAKAVDAQGGVSPFARIHALKFYDLVRAPESLLRVGQDLVDQYIRASDFVGARQFMESTLLPQLGQLRLAEYLVSIRSQYAVVLAYNREFSAAEAEMRRLQPYETSLMESQQLALTAQRDIIADLRRNGPPPDRSPPPELLETLARTPNYWAQPFKPPRTRVKIGRNEPCYCGSGRKFKKCHGK